MSIATDRRAQVSIQVGNQEISFETGKLAKQADGAVVVRSGETMVLATAVGRSETREGADFFPLTIDVEERMYAAGKIPGGFFKREGRASERAHGEIRRLCEAQEDLRRQAGKAKWLDAELNAEIESSQGHAIWERIQRDGLAASSAVIEELGSELAPAISMESTDDDIQRQIQVRTSLNMLLDKQRLAAVEGPVREQFGDDLRALTDAEQ